jgi:oxalate decarboxylase/phosphoglucose isomerase-like protein (cupin superfamily)
MSLGKILRYSETQPALEGMEVVRNYFQTGRITFGMSELLPGQTGAVDPGHQEADEVFFCMQGHVLCLFPEENHYYELYKGDALLIPPPVGHQLINIGEEKAVILFACAPKP